MTRYVVLPLVALCMGLAMTIRHEALAIGPPATQPTSECSAFATSPDARGGIAEALARARHRHQHVLLLFGADWCPWCRKLHVLFTDNKDISQLLKAEYQVVLVDVGRRDRNMDIAARYNVDLKKSGIPFLTVVDADGKVLVNQETGALEEGDRHSPQKVAEFLQRWKATPPAADEVLAGAQRQARAERKLVFLDFIEPGCPRCDALEDFLARQDVARILEKNYVRVLIDITRMEKGSELYAAYGPPDRRNTTLPWYVILDADGNMLAGASGYPSTEDKREQFCQLIASTARRATAADLAELRRLVQSAPEVP